MGTIHKDVNNKLLADALRDGWGPGLAGVVEKLRRREFEPRLWVDAIFQNGWGPTTIVEITYAEIQRLRQYASIERKAKRLVR